MARIVVLGGGGYAGSAIAREAAGRGHDVTVFGRSAPKHPAPGVTTVRGSVLVPSELDDVVAGANVIVASFPPTGELETTFVRVHAEIAALAEANGSRLGVVGGAGTLLMTPDGPKAFESPNFPSGIRALSRASDAVLDMLRQSGPGLDWFVLSPPRGFGAHIPGEATGGYRLGGDVELLAGGHPAAISGADYALAFVDEIDRPAHRRERFAVAH